MILRIACLLRPFELSSNLNGLLDSTVLLTPVIFGRLVFTCASAILHRPFNLSLAFGTLIAHSFMLKDATTRDINHAVPALVSADLTSCVL